MSGLYLTDCESSRLPDHAASLSSFTSDTVSTNVYIGVLP